MTRNHSLQTWIILPAIFLTLLLPIITVQAADPQLNAGQRQVRAGSFQAYAASAYVPTPGLPQLSVDELVKDFTWPAQAGGEGSGEGQLNGEPLVHALLQGGYVVYLRHASTDRRQMDTDTVRLSNCLTQRNLREEGRADARLIGKAFGTLGIPIGRIYASGYCRTRYTALLAFGWTEIREDLTGLPSDKLEDRKAAMERMLSTPPKPGENTILIGHGENIVVAAGIVIAEGEAAVFSPLGNDGFSLVGRIRPADWKQMIAASSLPGGAVDTAADFQPQTAPAFLADDPDLLLPDLQTLPPSHVVYQVIRPNEVELLRLTNTITNAGSGPMEIQGIHQDEKSTVIQRISKMDGSIVEQVAGEFVFHPTHDHWHFEDFAHYEIWSLTPAGELDALVASSGKVSFCLRDNYPIDIPNTVLRPVYTICGLGIQGISVGWTDVYEYDLPDQTIDITNLPVGVYMLRSITDPNNQLWELDDTNNASFIYIEILSDGVQIIRDPEVIRQLFVMGKSGEDS